MADPGNTVSPGLDQELFDTADAFVGWCNAAGGIDGRRLQLDKVVQADRLDQCVDLVVAITPPADDPQLQVDLRPGRERPDQVLASKPRL